MNERFNAFISYAWRDNEVFVKGQTGWVDTFVDRLRKLLHSELPRSNARNSIWLDYERMRGNHDVSRQIREKLEASRLLVPFLSKSYLDSPWCRQELEIFLKLHGPNSGRIFPVWMEPLENLPPELAALLKYSFWYEDKKKQPRTRWFPDIDPTDREYGFIQQDMTRDMGACLKKILAAETDQPSADPEPAVPPPRRVCSNHVVLVNGGREDADLVCQVAACLCERHGVDAILPLSALPASPGLKSSAITKNFRDLLSICTSMLIVFKKGPEHQIQQQIIEYLKYMPRRPKGLPPASIDLCRPANGQAPMGVHLARMAVHECDPDCAADCARRFAERLPS